jgi:hypothetical protein
MSGEKIRKETKKFSLSRYPEGGCAEYGTLVKPELQPSEIVVIQNCPCVCVCVLL